MARRRRVSFVPKRGPNKGKRVTFTTSGKKSGRKVSAYNRAVGKAVREAVKGVPKGKRMVAARKAMKDCAKKRAR